MDMLYVEHPLLFLLPAALLLWQLLVYRLKKAGRLSPLWGRLLEGVGVVGHAAALTAILLMGGTLQDGLLTALLGGAASLLLSPKADADREEDAP